MRISDWSSDVCSSDLPEVRWTPEQVRGDGKFYSSVSNDNSAARLHAPRRERDVAHARADRDHRWIGPFALRDREAEARVVRRAILEMRALGGGDVAGQPHGRGLRPLGVGRVKAQIGRASCGEKVWT